MDRDELARRYREAQFHAMAQAAELRAHAPQEDTKQEQPDTAPTAPNLAQIMGVHPREGVDDYISENDRLRRYCGLK